MSSVRRQRAAVIGSGVSGLTAAFLLQRNFDVTLFEKDQRLGGHAHTHDVATASGPIAVDSGFIVCNDRTYPLFFRLLTALGVSTLSTEMSMSIRCEGCSLEYAGGRGITGLLARPPSALRPPFLRMLGEIVRFHRDAKTHLVQTTDARTLGSFLDEGGYSRFFIAHYMVPLVACVWSSGAAEAVAYPARYLFTFLDNHGLLTIRDSPHWRVVVGGSRTYVDSIASRLSAVASAVPVRSVTRTANGVAVRTGDADVQHFDSVVIATHADDALTLLTDPTPIERKLLASFKYSRNETVLHDDLGLLPRTRGARASWNYTQSACEPSFSTVSVSYDMNRLQRLNAGRRCVVTLNGSDRIAPERVIERMVYHHPVLTTEAVEAQIHLPQLNRDRLAFAGAYHGWGFHEDGVRSGLEAARSFGVDW
jgi:predicted NAD/FAD-binding protein